ncbi:MAG: efflux RND transporter periplasmic adaptor subunit, partial [Lachnospiraceae bacterium]|nr:efflux RND transporter periplasmic adaptor subunit [Lachnospiraceae bacterium]
NELLNLQTTDKLQRLETALNGITADFDGVVTSVSVTEGARVGEGTILITVESSEEVVVRFGASKYDLEDLAVGQSAVVTITGNEYEGELTHIDHMATSNEAGSSMVMAEVTILNPDDRVYLGVDGKVKITTATEENALLVPVEAVNTDRTGDFCYVVEDGIARMRYVTTGISSSTEIQILEGLQEGEEVITMVSGTLADGVPVVAMNSDMMGMED